MVLDKNLAFVLPIEQYLKVKRTCELRGEDLSSFARRAVYIEMARLGQMSAEEKKALGMI